MIARILVRGIRETGKSVDEGGKAFRLAGYVQYFNGTGSFASHQRDKGTPLSHISYALAHTSVGTTENYIAGLPNEFIQKMANNLTTKKFHESTVKGLNEVFGVAS